MSDPSPNAGRRFLAARFPFHELLGIVPGDFADGVASLRLVIDERHLRSQGIVHGGVLATLVDVALGASAATTLPDGHDLVTAQLNMNFLKPVRVGDELTATGTVLHRGRRTAVSQVQITTADGTAVAVGTGTLMILEPRS